MKERLDKALVNLSWYDLLYRTHVLVDPAVGSDHSPIIVDIDWTELRDNRCFKVEAM